MKGISKEAELSIAASSKFPGFRFSPTDEELILYYLKKKLDGFDKCVEVIPEVDICKFEPWDLPAKAVINSDEEWFFFSPRGKKYPNGSQSRRATEIGYWKATGKERAVKSGPNLIGTKRTLVFHIGRAPKGDRTEWTMHEYCMAGKGQDTLVICRLRRKLDYHPINGVDGEILFTKPVSMIESSVTPSGFGSDHLGTSSKEKNLEYSLKKCTSSHDSHSVEQVNSASETDGKFRDEIMQPESSGHHVNEEDDLFGDILKDNIIQLDEYPPDILKDNIIQLDEYPPDILKDSIIQLDEYPPDILKDNIIQLDEYPPTSMANVVQDTSTVSIVPRASNHLPAQKPSVPILYPSQGTANRRIRLRKLRRWSVHKEELKQLREHKVSQYEKGWMSLKKNYNKLYVVVVIMTFVGLFFTFGMSWCSYSPPLPS